MKVLKIPLTGVFENDFLQGISHGYNFFIGIKEAKYDQYRKIYCFTFKIFDLMSLENFKKEQNLFTFVEILDLPFKKILYKRAASDEFMYNPQPLLEETLKGLFFNFYLNDIKDIKDIFTNTTLTIRHKEYYNSDTGIYEETFVVRIGPPQKTFNRHTGTPLYKKLCLNSRHVDHFNLTINNEILWISK